MKRYPVDSSNIVSIGYDPNQLILEVEFKDRSVYQYFQVPLKYYEELMGASSHGSYLSQRIKPFFEYTKI